VRKHQETLEGYVFAAFCRKLPAPYLMVRLQTAYDLQFSHNTSRLHTIVHCDPSRSSKVNDTPVI